MEDAGSATTNRSEQPTVVIVGGGIAGLCAAYLLSYGAAE